MRRLTLLLAGAALWLFLAAIPALADGGPHVASVNNGSSTLTADSCAGCHRVHTAQGAMLLNTSEEELCASCHGASSTGATTDVMTGIQYAPATDGTRTSTQLGALRGGGFDQARIGDPFRYQPSSSRYSKVQVASAPVNVNSAHLPAIAGLTQPGKAWGNGANGSGAGPSVTISCGSCHNPHGNGQYRILNTLPAVASETTAGTFSNAWKVQIFDYGVVVAPNVFRSVSSMGVLNGDTITITGNTNSAANKTGKVTMVDGPDSGSTPDDNLFTLDTVTSTTSGTGGTATRDGGVKVTDAANLANATRNYTVIQKATVFANVTTSAGVYTAPGHTFAVGDFVTVANLGGCPPSGSVPPSDAGTNCGNTTAKVATVAGNTFTLAGVTYTGDATGGTAVGKNEVLLASQVTSSSTSGDYFHYRVPWNGTKATSLDQPNGAPGGQTPQSVFTGGFGEQMAAWCASCHSRYWAWSEPTEDPDDTAGTTGPAYANPRPGDAIFEYQHRTRGASGRGCLTCHVSHGSNAEMTGPYSSTFTFPDGTASNNSRLLKVDNRGTCQLCHEPTGTGKSGDQYPPAPYPVPGTP